MLLDSYKEGRVDRVVVLLRLQHAVLDGLHKMPAGLVLQGVLALGAGLDTELQRLVLLDALLPPHDRSHTAHGLGLGAAYAVDGE